MPDRPALTPDLPAGEFRRWYWLRSELAAFARAQGLAAHGPKADLAARIATWLATGERPAAPPPRRAGPMPATFTPDTVIGPGWRCTAALRDFLTGALGPGFRFDATMRDHVLNRPGTTLGQAMTAWQAARANAAPAPIAPQFEYNRFTRAFRQTRPNATRAEVIAAWLDHRARPREE